MMIALVAKVVRFIKLRTVVATRPGFSAIRKKSAVSFFELRRDLTATRMENTARVDALIKAMMEHNSKLSAESSSRFETLSILTSNRMDRVLGVVVTALGIVVTVVIAGVGYLDGKNSQLDRKIEAGNAQLNVEMKEMDRKIETGNAQLKVEIKEMDRKIETGNAQLKEDLVKLLKWC
jgi:uncharacterized membrane protein YciS (DUF1049 family)